MPVVNFPEVDEAQDFSPLPEGEYLCGIASIDADKHTAAGDEMWELRLIVEDGDCRGRSLFDRISFGSAALPRVKLLCGQLGIDVTGSLDIQPELLIGRAVYVTVATQSYEDKRTGEEKKVSKVAFAGYRRAGGGAAPQADISDEELPF